MEGTAEVGRVVGTAVVGRGVGNAVGILVGTAVVVGRTVYEVVKI